MAWSVALPSRRKNEPGILPAAYMRSSMSTVRGKKSMPSRTDLAAVAVTSTIGVADGDGHGAVGEAGELAGLEGQGLVGPGRRDRTRRWLQPWCAPLLGPAFGPAVSERRCQFPVVGHPVGTQIWAGESATGS